MTPIENMAENENHTPSVLETLFTQKTGECACDEPVNAAQRQLENVEDLIAEFKRLAVKHESALEEEGIRDQLEHVERWVESYRIGLRAAAKMAQSGPELLMQIRERLKLAADELNRMEEESPTAVGKTGKAEDMIKATRKIDRLIPLVEQVFDCCKPEPASAPVRETIDA